MRRLCVLVCCLATFAAAWADPFYVWLEAEALGGWTQVKSEQASGGTFAAGGSGSGFCGDYVPLPGKAKFRAWARVCEAGEGSRRGTVTITTPPAEARTFGPLGGKGGGAWTWYDLGEYEGEAAVVELKGLEAWPAEVFMDCLLLTSDPAYTPPDALPESGRFDYKAFRAPWIPRVALLYPDYEYAGYRPRDEWDEDLNGLGWTVDKFETKDAGKLWGRLGEYDIVLMAALTTATDDSFMVAGAAEIKAWLEKGGLLIYTDCNYPEHVGWLGKVGLGGVEVVDGRPSIRGGGIGDGPRWPVYVRVANPINSVSAEDPSACDRPLIYCRHQRPGFPPMKWRHLELTDEAWRRVTGGEAGELSAMRAVGSGHVLVTSNFKGLGLGRNDLGDLFALRQGTLQPVRAHVYVGACYEPDEGEEQTDWRGISAELRGSFDRWRDDAPDNATVRLVLVGANGLQMRELSAAGPEQEKAAFHDLPYGEYRLTVFVCRPSDGTPVLRATRIVQMEDPCRLTPEQECLIGDSSASFHMNIMSVRRGDGTDDQNLRLHWSVAPASAPPGKPWLAKATDDPVSSGVLNLALWEWELFGFSLTMPDLQPGLQMLSVKVTDKEEVVATEQTPLEVAPPSRDRVPAIRYDPNGLSIDGRYFFPLGFFAVNKESLKILAENGFTAAFGGGEEYLDEAQRVGIKVFQGCSWDLEQLKWDVSRLREHPALVAHYVMDEPSNSGHTIAQLREMNRIVGERDPMRPKFFIDNDPLEFPSCIPEVDIIMLDPYCISGPKASLERIVRDINYARDIAKQHGPEKPVCTILQAHPFDGDGGLVMPSPEQIRAETYLAITEGARGVFYFLFEEIDGLNGIHNPDGSFEEPQWQEMKRIAKELPGLHEALFADHTSLKCSDARMRASLRRCAKEDVVLAVNMTAEEYDAEVDVPSQASATPALRVHMAPYDVHVLRFAKGEK